MGYTESECKDTQNVDAKQQYEAKYPENEYGTQNMSTAAQLIRVQSEQIGRRPTFRDLLDRIMAGVNSGEFMMQDPVPEGFFEDGHIDVARYIAGKYKIGSDADGQESDLRVRGCEGTGEGDGGRYTE